MTLHLMAVPGWLQTAVNAGTAFVDGAVVKDMASKQILAHLQPTQRLANQVMNLGFSLTGGPVSAAVSMVSSVVGNVQLLQIKRMVEQVQLVASIGAASSVLNLGVSVGGFALVLRSLSKLDDKVGGVALQVNKALANQHADFMGKVKHALRRADEAYALTSSQERTRYWREAESVLAEVTEAGLQRVAHEGLTLEGQDAALLTTREHLQLLAQPELLGGLRLLTTVSAARSEMLLCLGEPGAAAPVLQRVVQWLQPLPRDAMLMAQDRIRGQILPPSQIKAAALQARRDQRAGGSGPTGSRAACPAVRLAG